MVSFLLHDNIPLPASTHNVPHDVEGAGSNELMHIRRPNAVMIPNTRMSRSMNAFDTSIIHFLNGFSHHSVMFDSFVGFLADNSLLKGGVMMALFWWVWAEGDDAKPERHELLLFGLFASVFAVFLARILALMLPFRARPIHNPLLGFQIPYEMNPDTLLRWSSFPSDHAALFFALATSLWFVSKRTGLLAYCYAFFVICLPRIYVGIHYPTDIIAGALLGIGTAALSNVLWLRKSVTQPLLGWIERIPARGYVFLFLFSFEIGEQFDSLRHIAVLGFHSLTFALQALR
jgi:undecaprenyl-diphosphatase